MIAAMDQWQRAIRPSSASGPPRPKGVTALTEEELILEIGKARLENKMLTAQVEVMQRWLEQYGEHTDACRSFIGMRCDCGLGIFLP